MSCKPSCPFFEGHECLIWESKPTLSGFRIWLAQNVGEEIESSETLLNIYTQFTLTCMRCTGNPHRSSSSRMVSKVDENLRRIRRARDKFLLVSSGR
jgi:hypothetical protein